MPPAADQTNTVENELRVVVDAQIVLAMFLARRDRPGVTSPKRQLLKLLPTSTFRWLWTPDIINDSERGAAAIEMAGPWAVGVRVLPLRTRAMGIRFSNGNANRVTVINFLSSLWSLIDNQSGLK